jgi:quinol monooxygenase YgiN
LAALRELAPASRVEPGCLTYIVYQDPTRPSVFELFEVYDNEAAYAAHGSSEHFTRLAVHGAIPRLSGRERAFYTTLDV